MNWVKEQRAKRMFNVSQNITQIAGVIPVATTLDTLSFCTKNGIVFATFECDDVRNNLTGNISVIVINTMAGTETVEVTHSTRQATAMILMAITASDNDPHDEDDE